MLNVIVLEEKLALLTHDLRVVEFASLRAQNALIFVHDLQVCASLNSEDDVIYLRALCKLGNGISRFFGVLSTVL